MTNTTTIKATETKAFCSIKREGGRYLVDSKGFETTVCATRAAALVRVSEIRGESNVVAFTSLAAAPASEGPAFSFVSLAS